MSSRYGWARALFILSFAVGFFLTASGNAKAEAPYKTIWTSQMDISANDHATGVSVDSTGNSYIVGNTSGDLDGNANAGFVDLFVVKYDSAGEKQWTRQMGTRGWDGAYGVSVDGSGNVYVVGETFGGLDGNTNAGNDDLFVVKYNARGEKQWTRQMGTTSYDGARGVSVDGSGNVYVAGFTDGELDGNTNIGGMDLFVIKYNSEGVKQWTRQMGTTSWDFANGVSVDGGGNVYVAGYTWGSIDGNINVGDEDLFVIKYNSNGVKKWTRQMGTTGLDEATGVSVDNSGNVYVTGITYYPVADSTEGGVDVTQNASTIDLFDLFVVKYNSAGVMQWTHQMGTSGNDIAMGVSVDGPGNVYVVGDTTGGLDGNTNSGDYDIFIDKYNSAGVKMWTRQMGTTGDDVANGVSVDGSGNVYVVGYTWGWLDGNTNVGWWAVKLGPADQTSSITSPTSDAFVGGSVSTITGTASAVTGVAFVEVSTDGGTTWHTARGTTSWRYTWNPPADGSYSILSRATDSLNNEETPGASITVTVDKTPPTSLINAQVRKGANTTITGTATDGTGSGVGRVDVSTDGGRTWRRATDTSGNGSWSSWTSKLNMLFNRRPVMSRATDRAGNVETPHRR